jgi:hypothetical protein
LEQVITRFETGQIEVNLANSGPSGWRGLRGRRSGREKGGLSGVSSFARFFMFVASLAGGIFLLTDAHQFIAAWFCFGLTGLITLGVLRKS